MEIASLKRVIQIGGCRLRARLKFSEIIATKSCSLLNSCIYALCTNYVGNCKTGMEWGANVFSTKFWLWIRIRLWNGLMGVRHYEAPSPGKTCFYKCISNFPKITGERQRFVLSLQSLNRAFHYHHHSSLWIFVIYIEAAGRKALFSKQTRLFVAGYIFSYGNRSSFLCHFYYA